MNIRINLRNFRVQVRNSHIEDEWIKYLVVVFDWTCRKVNHVNMVAIKVQKSTMDLWRLKLNNGGPRYGIRKVFDPAVQSVLMYADLIGKRLWSTTKAGISWKRHKEEWNFEFLAHTGLYLQSPLIEKKTSIQQLSRLEEIPKGGTNKAIGEGT